MILCKFPFCNFENTFSLFLALKSIIINAIFVNEKITVNKLSVISIKFNYVI